METNGAVFLPAAGHRVGTFIEGGDGGNYWSSTTYSYGSQARKMVFGYNNLFWANDPRYRGLSVRLVAPAEN